MSKKPSTYQESFDEISFELSTNKKQKKQNQFVYSSSSAKALGTLPNTERKTYTYNVDSKLYMDQATTPIKYEMGKAKQTFNGSYKVSQTSKYRQILLKLDQTEQKLVLSEKKYGELWRKYQTSCQIIDKLTKTSSINNNSQKYTNQNISQHQNQYYINKLHTKQAQNQTLKSDINALKIQLRNKTQQLQTNEHHLHQLQSELQQKKYKLVQIEEQLKTIKEINSKSYERIIGTLKLQIQSFQKQLTLKNNQINNLKEMTLQNKESRRNKSVQVSCLELQQEISRLHREKLNTIASYEDKITSLRQKHQLSIRQIQQQAKQKLQQQMLKSMDNRLRKQEIQTEWTIDKKKLTQKINYYEEQNKKLKKDLQYIRGVNKQLQDKLEEMIRQAHQSINEQESKRDERLQLNQLFQQLQTIRKDFSLLQLQLDSKSSQLQQLQTQKIKLHSQLSRLQSLLNQKDTQILQKDKNFKQSTSMIMSKVNSLEEEKQLIERQLLAERLQTFKLQEELSQLQINLKKEYQLSIENLKAELSLQIHSAQEEKNLQAKEKQHFYIQLKQLQKKYELLATQMLTVDDMMSIATKVHKRHSHYLKK